MGEVYRARDTRLERTVQSAPINTLSVSNQIPLTMPALSRLTAGKSAGGSHQRPMQQASCRDSRAV